MNNTKVAPRKKFKSAEKLMQEVRKHAEESAKYLRGLNGAQIIREMRDNAKW